MSQELVYTSAPKGLRPGSKGFCTVAMTAGMSAAWVDRLEPLSAYRAIFPLGDPKSDFNPVNFSHWRINVAGKTKSVLSYVAFAGADYTGRSNKLAHHIVLEATEQTAGGPAWLMLKPGLIRTHWTGEPQQFPSGPILPAGDGNRGNCATWTKVRGDAGWAGVLAESFVFDPAKPAYIVYAPGTDMLRLFDESLSLIDPTKRWQVTFSTFFSELPLNLTCAWRAVVAGTPAASEALRSGARALILDLTRSATTAPSGAYADAARAGTGPVITTASSRVIAAPVATAIPAVKATAPDDSDIISAPFTRDIAAPVLTGRKRLATASDSVDLAGFPDFSRDEDDIRPKAPRRSTAGPGISKSIFVSSIVGCLILGAAGTFAAYSYMLGQLRDSQTQARKADERASSAPNEIATARGLQDKAESEARLAKVAAGINQGLADSVPGLNADLKKLDDQNKQLVAELNKSSDNDSKIRDLTAENKTLRAKVIELSKTTGSVDPNGNGTPHESIHTSPRDLTPTLLPDTTGDIKFKLDPSGDTMPCELALPFELADGRGISVVWPNNSAVFEVTAGGKKYKLNQKPTGKQVVIQAPLAGADSVSNQDIIKVELLGQKLRFTRLESQNPAQGVVATAAAKALDDSVYVISSRIDEKDQTSRVCLGRVQPPRIQDRDKNIFDKPSMPEGITIDQLKLTVKTSSPWIPASENRPGVLTYKVSSDETLEVTFKLVMAPHSADEWQIAVDMPAYFELKRKKTSAEEAKKNADAAATKADEKLQKLNDSKASGEAIRKATDEKKTADDARQKVESAAGQYDEPLNHWKTNYDTLTKDLSLNVRLPNGVELLQITPHFSSLQQ